MTGRLHLSNRHRKEIVSILRDHLPGAEVWAYGSRVQGRSHDGSDLDLVVRGRDGAKVSLARLGALTEAFQESRIPFVVEARDWVRLPASFHREIERCFVVLVEGAAEEGADSAQQAANERPERPQIRA